MTHTDRAYYIKRLEVVKELLNEFRSNTSLVECEETDRRNSKRLIEMKTNPRMFMLKIRKVPKKICSWCLNHVGLCNASFLLGIGIGQAIHGNYTGLLLQIPFVVLWWLYNHMEVLCCDMQRIASNSLNNARESQRIAEDFKERYFALLKTINDICMGQNESDNNKTEKDDTK